MARSPPPPSLWASNPLALFDPQAALLPEIIDIPATATAIAEAVAVRAVADGVAPQRSEDELRQVVRAQRCQPAYPD